MIQYWNFLRIHITLKHIWEKKKKLDIIENSLTKERNKDRERD